MSDELTVTMDLRDGYRFAVDFGQPGVPVLLMDEPSPLGEGSGPSASHVLAAAVGNCLSASALFCLRRAHIDVRGMHTTVTVEKARNEAGRLRIGAMRVALTPEIAPDDIPRIGRCLELFEDFCVVSQSVRQGIDIAVAVNPVAATAGTA